MFFGQAASLVVRLGCALGGGMYHTLLYIRMDSHPNCVCIRSPLWKAADAMLYGAEKPAAPTHGSGLRLDATFWVKGFRGLGFREREGLGFRVLRSRPWDCSGVAFEACVVCLHTMGM